jgi:predicted PolB exonuclease-like 3'-5' exonuclease
VSRDVLIVDIETTRDGSIPAYKPGDPSAFPPPPFHRVEMIGALVLRDDKVARLSIIDEGSEAATIRKAVAFIGEKSPLVVTFNGRRFDVPVLAARSMLHGIPFGWSFDLHRYKHDEHEDVADVLTSHGASPSASLDAWSRMCGWPGKLDKSGGEIDALLAAGKRDHVRHYCTADVVLTAALWMRTNLLRGSWSLDRYQAAASSLLAATRARLELAAWCDGVDELTFLLPQATSAAA